MLRGYALPLPVLKLGLLLIAVMASAGLPVGVCALPWGIELPTASIPTPAEYFPLSNYTASAWPLSDQWFWNTTSTAPVTWVFDDIFGPVIDCQVHAALWTG